MSWISKRLSQTRVLLRKNWWQSKRNWKSTISFLLIPTGIMLLLLILSAAVHNNSDLGKAIHSYTPKEVGAIPKCTIGKDLSLCHTIAYNYADHPGVQAAMQELMREQGLTADDVVTVPGNRTAMNKYLFENYNQTQGAYVFTFDRDAHPTELPLSGDLYILQVNSTLYGNCNQEFGLFYKCGQENRDVGLPMQRAINQAVMRTRPGGNPNAVVALSYLPFAHPVIFNFSIKSSSAALFLMFACIFPLVLMLMQIVGEKEAKLKYAMRLIGVKTFSYWASWWIYFLILFTLANLVVLALCEAAGFKIISGNAFGLSLVLFFLFGLAMISNGLFLSTFFNAVKSARMIALFYLFLFGLFSGVSGLVFSDDSSVPDMWRTILALFPPVLFNKSLTDLTNATSGQGVTADGIRWSQRSNFTERFPFTTVYNWLLFDALLYFVLAWYFDGIMPDVMGVRRPLWFPLQPAYWGIASKTPAPTRGPSQVPLTSIAHDDDVDDDVLAERERVHNHQFAEEPAVLVRNIRKNFKPMCGGRSFLAVDDISFSIPSSSLFCLLGPNGAGKSTTINMLTGGVIPTSGDMLLRGVSVAHDVDRVRQMLGVCPQFDVVFDDLTGRENLEIFAALKGLSGADLAYEVATRLKEIHLLEEADAISKGYSGGMRRRLSLAMALTCDPQVVLLDEPTTGLDPVARRQVWDIIENAKKRHNRAIILTTHAMDEADVLGDRIAIMANGRIRCIGTALHLKSKFGSGYRVTAMANQEVIGDVWNRFIAAYGHLPVVETTPTFFVIQVSREQTHMLPELLAHLDSDPGVHDVQLNLSTLESVFLRIAEEAQGIEFQREPALDQNTSVDIETPLGVDSRGDIVTAPPADASYAESAGMINRVASPRAANEPLARSGFGLQFRALFAKNYHLQKRRKGTNCCQICCPSFIVFILIMLQLFVLSSLNKKVPLTLQPTAYTASEKIWNEFGAPTTVPWTASAVPAAAANAVGAAMAIAPNQLLHNATYDIFSVPSLADMQQELFNAHFHGGGYVAGYDYTDVALNSTFAMNLLFNRTFDKFYGPLTAQYGIAFEAYTAASNAISEGYRVLFSDTPVMAHEDKFNIVTLLAATLFPLILFFQAPMFVGSIMYDKERKLTMIMQMMGMHKGIWWAVEFVFDFVLYVLVLVVLFVMGYAFKFEIFIKNDFLAFFFLFLLWGTSMIALSFLFTAWFSREFIATVMSYLVVIVSWIAGSILVGVVEGNAAQSFFFSLYPFFAFQRGVGYLAEASSEDKNGIRITKLNDPANEIYLGNVYAYLAVETVIILFLAWYLDQVYPAGFGVGKSPTFFLKPSFWRPQQRPDDEERMSLMGHNVEDKFPVENEDDDVAAERQRVLDPSHRDEYAVRLINLRKEFGPKVAVHNVAFGVRRGECLGLLGHNGAGKTTMASMLSGLIEPTHGTAFVEGNDIRYDMDRVYSVLGVCPQHDLVWPTMTAREHLLFYGRLKGLTGAPLKSAVKKVLADLNLSYVANKQVGSYSGGMRRRVSIGMSIIGSVASNDGAGCVILLDEPTCGLDPKNVADIHDIISRITQSGASVLLTTHSMQEAESLCDRICIAAAGVIRCAGTPEHLKHKFAEGYRLTFTLEHDRIGDADQAIAFIESVLPTARHLPLSLGATHHFSVPLEDVELATVFAQVEAQRVDYGITDWTLERTTLEDVFLNIARDAEFGTGTGAGEQPDQGAGAAAGDASWGSYDMVDDMADRGPGSGGFVTRGIGSASATSPADPDEDDDLSDDLSRD